ncbi:MAG: ABC transporter permease, partial [Bacillota bacterium]|nr:ABC transporter permease [Bacillota bacterium]
MESTKNTEENARGKSIMTDIFGKWWLLILTVALAGFFSIMEHNFLTPSNLLGILSNACLAAIAGCGLTCVMATGEIDFSTGSAMTLSACTMTVLLNSRITDNLALAIVLGLAVSILLGLFNAYLHLCIGIPAFLATLSSSLLAKGVAQWITGGTTIYGGIWDPKAYTFIGQHYLLGMFPMPFVVLVLVGAVILFLMEFTIVGKSLFAVGANQTACEYIGINARKYKLIAFVLCALMCGISGIVQASMANGAGPSMAESYQLLSVMVTVMGGTFLKKGVFNVPGTLLAGILVTMVSNGMIM